MTQSWHSIRTAKLGVRPIGLMILTFISSLHAQEMPDMSTLNSVDVPTSPDPIFLGPGETHEYSFDLSQEEWLHLGIEQLGVDVQLRWHAPEALERPLVLLDRPTGARGREELRELAERPGRFRLEILGNKPESSGSYRFVVFERRPAQAKDYSILSADRNVQEARQLLKAGEPQTSLDLLEAALTTLSELDQPLLEADALELQGRAYFALGQMQQALDSWQSAAVWYRLVGEKRLLAAVLHNRTVVQLRLGRGHQTLQALEESRQIFAEEGDTWAEASAVSRQASIEHRSGRLHRALDRYDEAITLARRADRVDVAASILIDRGIALLTLRRPQEALESFVSAGKGSEASESAQDEARETVRLQGLAEAHHQMGNSEKALEFANRALQKQYRVDDPRTRATLLNTIGNIHLARNDLPSARRAVTHGLEYAASTRDAYTAAFLGVALGHIERLEGRPETALNHYARVDRQLEELASSRLRASNRVRGAQALIDLGRLKEAWERLQPALSDIEDLRSTAARQDHRLGYFAFRQEYYEIALDLLSTLHQHHPDNGYGALAFRVHERRIARELLDRSGLGPRSALPTEESARLMRLEERIRTISSASNREQPQPDLRQALSDLYAARSREVVDSPALDPESQLDLALENLDPNTLLLSFSLGPDRGHLWIVDHRSIELYGLPPRSDLEPKARDLADLLDSARLRSQRKAEELASELGSLLLGPIGSRLEDYQRLVIIGDGALLQIPFAYLRAPRHTSPLISSHEVVNLPSLSLLPHLREGRAAESRRRTLALFGDPIYGPDDPRWVSPSKTAQTSQGPSEIASRVLRSENLARLPNSRTEVEAIGQLASGSWQVELLTGSRASRQAFHSVCSTEGTSGCDVLHIASHALLASEPELSGLMLSFLDDAGERQEGFVPAFEIAGRHLPARLVVLSACQTGTGTPTPGEGMRGLSWSFFHAGAHRVIASLWKVGDQPTALLMEHFYAALLQDRQSPAAALRQAQNSLRSQGYPARDWAAFVFQGNWEPFLPPLRQPDSEEPTP